jgi:DNA mismatch repair ATPase MutS
MQSALSLSDEEFAKVQEVFEARESEVSVWMAANGAKLEQLEKKMASAAKARDLTGVRNATSQAKPLRNELRELVATFRDAIPDALSEDNRFAWAAHQLSQRLLELMDELNLAPEQIEQIEAESHSAIQYAANESNPASAGFLTLEKFAETKVLTKDQVGS